jgi:zinc protease
MVDEKVVDKSLFGKGMFRKSVFSLCTLLLSGSVMGCYGKVATVQPPLPSRADEVAAFKPVKPEVWQLPNGLEVMFLPDQELPLVRGRLFIKGGALWTPSSTPGAVGATGELMRGGGTSELPADELDKELERLAAQISTSFATEFGSAGFSCLSSDFERVFSLFSQVLLTPRFESEKVSLWKGQALEGIRRRKEEPNTVGTIAFNQLLYGSTPYGRIAKSADITRITRSELQKLHKELVKPDGAVLVVTGKIPRTLLERVVERELGGWISRGSELPPPPTIEVEPKPGIYFIELPFSQATIFAGQLGVPRLTPDYPAIEVFNEVFGASGFGSRLMQRVRTEKGLSYSIYGAIAPGIVKGMNFITAQTKAESVDEALAEILLVVEELQHTMVSESDLVERKSAIKNSFVFNFDSPDNVAGRMAKLRLLKYPEDYDATFLPKIEAVTPSDVRNVAKERWNRDKFVIVIIGNDKAYRELEALKTAQAQDSALQKFELIKLSFDQALEFE